MEDKVGSVLYQGRSIVIHKGAVYNDFITIDKGKEKTTQWRTVIICKCTHCNTLKEIRPENLVKGLCINCNCKTLKNHGMSKTKLYRSWVSMMARCFDIKNIRYSSYGGRGITVCSDWQKAGAFLDWAIKNGYEEGLTLERVDVYGNYCPENCTWIPLKDQCRNKRKLHSKTGITGVSNYSCGYEAYWTEGGKKRRKKFSFKEHGENALCKASDYRKQQISRLISEGIYYGPNHGE